MINYSQVTHYNWKHNPAKYIDEYAMCLEKLSLQKLEEELQFQDQQYMFYECADRNYQIYHAQFHQERKWEVMQELRKRRALCCS